MNKDVVDWGRFWFWCLSAVLVGLVLVFCLGLVGCSGGWDDTVVFSPKSSVVVEPVNVSVNESVNESVSLGFVGGVLSVYYFDLVGDSVLFQFDDFSVLVGGGSRVDAGVLLGKLREVGVDRLDVLVIPFCDERVVGGLPFVGLRMKPEKVYESGLGCDLSGYVDFKDLFNDSVFVKDEFVFDDSGVLFKLVVPYDESGFFYDDVENSLLVKGSFGGGSVLFGSGCGMSCEGEVLKDGVGASVLLSGVRGCDVFGLKFLGAVSPELVVSRSDCSSVLDRLSSLAFDVRSVDSDVVVRVDNTKWWVE